MNTTPRAHSTSFHLPMPVAGRRAIFRTLAAATFAVATAVAAQIAVPVPGTAVPMTLQTLAVMLAAMTLGARLGSLSMGLYLLMGLVGLPVFAHGLGGLGAFTGATAGFLAGFIIAQPALNAALRLGGGGRAGIGRLALAVGLALGVIYLAGFVGLVTLGQRSIADALVKDLAPFALGDLTKGAIAVVIGLKVVPWRRGREW